jgi:hypothetical protein
MGQACATFRPFRPIFSERIACRVCSHLLSHRGSVLSISLCRGSANRSGPRVNCPEDCFFAFPRATGTGLSLTPSCMGQVVKEAKRSIAAVANRARYEAVYVRFNEPIAGRKCCVYPTRTNIEWP